jgi:hypothetical protein
VAAKGGAAELDRSCGAEEDHPAGVKRWRAPGRHSRCVIEHYDVIISSPSAGAVHAALTAMANAIRVGEHRLSRLA